MKHILNLILSASLVFCLFSCGSSGNQEFRIQNYKTVVIDSISFNRLSEVKMLDYNDQTEEILVIDEQTREVFIMDARGEIVSSFQPFMEGPNSIERSIFGWSFLNNDEIVAYGQVYFNRLSKDGKRLQRMEYPIKPRGWVTLDYEPVMIESINGSFLTIIPGVDMGISKDRKTFQDSVSLVFQMDFKTGAFERKLRKPANSIYRQSDDYYGMGIPLFSKMNENTLAFTYSADTSVYIYDVLTDQVLKTISIPASFQPSVTPVSYESKESPKEESVNAQIFSTGEQVLLVKLGQIPEEVYKEIMAMGGQWWQSPELEAAAEKYMTRKHSLYSQNQFLGEVEWNVGKGFLNVVSTNSDFLWVQRIYEDERDYRTFLKVKIVPVED